MSHHASQSKHRLWQAIGSPWATDASFSGGGGLPITTCPLLQHERRIDGLAGRVGHEARTPENGYFVLSYTQHRPTLLCRHAEAHKLEVVRRYAPSLRALHLLLFLREVHLNVIPVPQNLNLEVLARRLS